MIVSIVLVIFFPMLIVMPVPPMVAVSRRPYWYGHTQPDDEGKDPGQYRFAFAHDGNSPLKFFSV
jgi:hypothetical protein